MPVPWAFYTKVLSINKRLLTCNTRNMYTRVPSATEYHTHAPFEIIKFAFAQHPSFVHVFVTNCARANLIVLLDVSDTQEPIYNCLARRLLHIALFAAI